jgi:GT2 family glycosyltransferase
MTDTVYVILLNFRGWADTVACLESLYASENVHFRVIVCDNASGDGSLDHIAAWADGRIEAETPATGRLSRLLGKVRRPLRVQRLDREAAETGVISPHAELVLVDNGGNLGFAAGNNVGLRLALAQPDMAYAWLLNNDTVVEPGCMAAMRDKLAAVDDRAVCGSVIHFFDRPEIIQALGGNRFNRSTGVASRSEGRFQHESEPFCPETTARRLAYVSGCSMLLPRRFLEEVGLMDEDYFLYYEEIDWFTRAGERFAPCIAADAHLYHREGRAIGSAGWRRRASAFADFHMYKSRFLFMRKHLPLRLPLCYAGALLDAGKCLVRGQVANARALLTAMLRPSLDWRPCP